MMIEMTDAQRDSIRARFLLDPDGCDSLDEMEERARPMWGSDPCILLPHCGVWYGIEVDGYTHT